MLNVELITGKSHQIRAHLASMNAPIVGDYKYGNKKINQFYKQKFNINAQLLHAYKIEMPFFEGKLKYLSNKIFIIELPKSFINVIGENNVSME